MATGAGEDTSGLDPIMALKERNLAESRVSHTESHDIKGGKGERKG